MFLSKVEDAITNLVTFVVCLLGYIVLGYISFKVIEIFAVAISGI